jgi:hypothetical protein
MFGGEKTGGTAPDGVSLSGSYRSNGGPLYEDENLSIFISHPWGDCNRKSLGGRSERSLSCLAESMVKRGCESVFKALHVDSKSQFKGILRAAVFEFPEVIKDRGITFLFDQM